MTNKELLQYFELLDEDDTEEDIENFEGIEIEGENGEIISFTLEDLRNAQKEGKVLADLLITK